MLVVSASCPISGIVGNINSFITLAPCTPLRLQLLAGDFSEVIKKVRAEIMEEVAD